MRDNRSFRFSASRLFITLFYVASTCLSQYCANEHVIALVMISWITFIFNILRVILGVRPKISGSLTCYAHPHTFDCGVNTSRTLCPPETEFALLVALVSDFITITSNNRLTGRSTRAHYLALPTILFCRKNPQSAQLTILFPYINVASEHYSLLHLLILLPVRVGITPAFTRFVGDMHCQPLRQPHLAGL